MRPFVSRTPFPIECRESRFSARLTQAVHLLMWPDDLSCPNLDFLRIHNPPLRSQTVENRRWKTWAKP